MTMDEGEGKEQSKSSENGHSLDPVIREDDGTALSSESQNASAENEVDACRTGTSQEVAEKDDVCSCNDEEEKRVVELIETSEASDRQSGTKGTSDPNVEVDETPVTACSKDANMDEHVVLPAGEKNQTHSDQLSGEKLSEICENDQKEEKVISNTIADRSPVLEIGGVRVLNDEALDIQPTTPPGKVHSEVLDETMLTESPAYSDDGKLVIGTPRSVESPVAVPGPAYEVDRTKHPADVGCEVEIVSDFLPVECTPSINQHTPSASLYTPSTSQCTPSTSYCETPEAATDLSLNQTPSTGPRPIRSKKRKKKRLRLARKKQRTVMPVNKEAIDQALGLDADLERKLEENAAKNNLTAINVKSILHHVITNEHVLSMVRNTMTDAGLVEIEREPAAYTPKLTRAKLKEATEKVGNMPYVWPLSPVKNKKAAAPGFIEINFSDDTSSDDEDYDPTLDELMREESDYESVTSQMSDFGSPCASTPPRSAQPSITESEVEDSPAPEPAPATNTPRTSQRPIARHLQVAPVPMGPPPPPPNPDRLGDDDAFLRELAAVTKEEANIIAHRTRSKLTIDKPLEAIEASFVAPDAEHDMYDVYESDHEDTEWKNWLASLYKTEDTANTEPTDDEQNDPEYNFLAEEEPEDKEDFRTDRAVRVSKKELNELLDEVVEAYGDEVDWLDDFDMEKFDQEPQSSLFDSLIQKKQKFSPSKFYTMPSAAPSSPSPVPGASTSSKFRLGEVLSSIIAAASSTDASSIETVATTAIEATAASATMTSAIDATMATEATFQSTSVATPSEATISMTTQQPLPPLQQQQLQPQPQPQSTTIAAATAPVVVQQEVLAPSVRQVHPVKTWTIEAKTLPSLTLNGEELEQFQQQMQQHVQLLCQMHVLARENDTLMECANQAKQFLAELDLLAGVNEDGMKSQGNVALRPHSFQSFFRSCNLGAALELIKTPKLPSHKEDEEDEYKERKPGTRVKAPPPLPCDLCNMIAKSNVFIHAELLPKHMFYDISRSSKIVFVEGEDKLITRGLDQFGRYDNGFQLIQSLMMPCKTSTQIRNRIKNLTCHRRSKVDLTNPIVIYKNTKQLVHSPSMCEVVKPHQATAPVNIRNNKKLPKWVLNIQGVQAHMRDCLREQEKAAKRPQTLSPLKPKVQIPIQISAAQDQKIGQVQVQVQDKGATTSSSVSVITQFPPETAHYVLASNVGLAAAPKGLILQPSQQFLSQGLLPRTVCEVKYVIDSPQMSPIAAGSVAVEGLPNVAQSSTVVEAVSMPTAQVASTSSANPVVNVPSSSTVPLASLSTNPPQAVPMTASQISHTVPQQTVSADASQMGTPVTIITTSSQSQVELQNTQAHANTARHSVVRTLQFSDAPSPAGQAPSGKMEAESCQSSGNDKGATLLPPTPTEHVLHTTQLHEPRDTSDADSVGHGNQETLYQSVERSPDAEAFQSVLRCRRRTSSIPLGVAPRDTVRDMIRRKRKKKKLSPRQKLAGFVSMSSLASKGMSSLNKFKLGTARKSPGKQHMRSPASKHSPGKVTVRMDSEKEYSPPSSKANQGSEESGKSNRTENSLVDNRINDADEDCIPLETALRQLDEEEETSRTSGPQAIAVENLVSLTCEENPSEISASPVKADKEVSVTVPTAPTASSETRPGPSTKHSPLQVTVRMDDKVPVEVPVPVGISSEPMQGITIGSSVGSSSQILAANPSRTASPSVGSAAIPEGDSPPIASSLPAVLQEDTTSQMSEGAASVSSNPKLPFDPPHDQSEMMASTATGGKSPTLDEQPSAREFLSGGEQGGPGEDGEEEMEMGRRSNVKVAAKRIKSKLRKDLESTVVLLDPDIVNQDPHKEREFAFARDFLDRVKDALIDNPDQYRNFLRVFNEHSENPNSSIADLYYSVKDVLSDRPDLIEEFTAFMPPDVALQCGVFLECLEFSKARLFLRQVEVHFYKQPAQIQRIIKTMIQWGETQRNYQDLKDALIPLLKGQPHLEQELSMLFPDSRPPENYMMDFEEINLTDEKKMPCDDFEEIELSESEEDEEGTVTKQQGRGAADRNILDPWKGLNDELQYGTRSCKCNCHETSQDSRVQRKTRHCAYCSEMVTRAELISSLRGLGPGRRRPMRDGSGRRRGNGVGTRRGRGSKMADGAKSDDGVGGSYPTNEAVDHLSKMCDNLADYLQDNASATEDEDDVEDDEDGGDEDHDDEEEDDDEDDHDDDDEDGGDEDEDEDEMGVATGDDDDDDVADHDDDGADHDDDGADHDDDGEGHEEDEEDDGDDREDEDEDDDEGGVATEDDADDEAEDGGELNHITSGESMDDLTGDHSPCTSQGSRETMASGNSNSGSQLSTSPASSHTTLLGSGVNMDTDSRSLTCSPTEFQNKLKGKEKANEANIDSEKKDAASAITKDKQSLEPENKVETAAEATKSANIDGQQDGQGKNDDAPASKGGPETERRDGGTQAPAGGKEMLGDGGGVKEETDDGDRVEKGGGEGGGALDPQQSTAGESGGALSVSAWNRDADKVLLQACQEKGASEETFVNVASQLTDKTPQQVKERFAILMKLFHRKSSQDEETSNDDGDDEEEEESEEEDEDSEEEEEENGGDETED